MEFVITFAWATAGAILIYRAIAQSGHLPDARRDVAPSSVFDGRELLSTRMYHDWTAMRAGLVNNLVETFGGAAGAIWTALGAVLLAWAAIAIPLIDASACAQHAPFARDALGLALATTAAVFGLHIAGARFCGIPLWCGLLFPLGYSRGAWIAAQSLHWRISGPISWMGRVYL